MTQFSNDNEGFSIPYPYLSKEYQNIQDQLERAQYICPLIHEQIEKLVHLDQIAEIDLKNPYLDEIIELELAYVNQFYISIHNLDQILDNEIYGPEQAGDSSNWVVNRGFVTQGSATNLLVRNNIFYSLRQPAYLNPNSTKCGRYCFIIWN